MRQEVKVVRDIPSIKVFVEDTRSKILSLLAINDMSISQLAEALDKDQSTIYRHLKKLENAGYVEVCGERKEHHIPEKLYGRTASLFLFSPTDENSKDEFSIKSWQKKHTKKVMDILETIGFDIQDRDQMLDEFAYFFKSVGEISSELIEAVQSEIKGMDQLTYYRIKLIITLYAITDDDEVNKEYKRLINMLDLKD